MFFVRNHISIFSYLIRTNFRADKFSRTSSARKLEIFARIYFRAPFTKIRNSVLIFAQFRANCWLKALFCIAFFKIWSLKIFARINFRAPATNLQKFGTNFRAISRKSRFCAKMRENLSARKLVRIRYNERIQNPKDASWYLEFHVFWNALVHIHKSANLQIYRSADP